MDVFILKKKRKERKMGTSTKMAQVSLMIYREDLAILEELADGSNAKSLMMRNWIHVACNKVRENKLAILSRDEKKEENSASSSSNPTGEEKSGNKNTLPKKPAKRKTAKKSGKPSRTKKLKNSDSGRSSGS